MRDFARAVSPPRGVLKGAQGSVSQAFTHRRVKPPQHLSVCIEHFWTVQWDLNPGSSQVQETLPHPNVHLTFTQVLDKQRALPTVPQLHGVKTAKFSTNLEGRARVFGVKFRPGGIRCFSVQSASSLTDRVVPASQLFGSEVQAVANQITSSTAVEQLSAFLAERATVYDPEIEYAGHLTDMIAENPTLTKVSALARKAGTSVRSLERLFKRNVGVSPKWVIRRYRLHEVLERIHSEQVCSFSNLAVELDYADQAHLIRDFKRMTGYSPAQYKNSTQMHQSP